jgi:hypothetical protein
MQLESKAFAAHSSHGYLVGKVRQLLSNPTTPRVNECYRDFSPILRKISHHFFAFFGVGTDCLHMKER